MKGDVIDWEEYARQQLESELALLRLENANLKQSVEQWKAIADKYQELANESIANFRRALGCQTSTNQ